MDFDDDIIFLVFFASFGFWLLLCAWSPFASTVTFVVFVNYCLLIIFVLPSNPWPQGLQYIHF